MLCIVGNKTDLEPQRKVPKEEALQYTQSIGGTYFEVSALHDQGNNPNQGYIKFQLSNKLLIKLRKIVLTSSVHHFFVCFYTITAIFNFSNDCHETKAPFTNVELCTL